VYYVHAKDTRIEHGVADINGVLDTTPGSEHRLRAWNYVTLGHGHDEGWWRGFLGALHDAGYDGVLSIEHEDAAQSPVSGVEESVALLRRALSPHAHAAA
jgi:sugar phosphate isomerase/epimerase